MSETPLPYNGVSEALQSITTLENATEHYQGSRQQHLFLVSCFNTIRSIFSGQPLPERAAADESILQIYKCSRSIGATADFHEECNRATGIVVTAIERAYLPPPEQEQAPKQEPIAEQEPAAEQEPIEIRKTGDRRV